MHGYVEGTTKLHPIQFHIYCVCNLKTTTGFQNEKRTNKQTNKQTKKTDIFILFQQFTATVLGALWLISIFRNL